MFVWASLIPGHQSDDWKKYEVEFFIKATTDQLENQQLDIQRN